MRIGILGAGHIGSTLVRKLSQARHDVAVANSRDPVTIDPRVLAQGGRAVSAPDALADAEVVILSMPLGRIPEIAPLISSLPAKAVVIDTSNYYPQRDGIIDAIEAGMAESLWVAEKLSRPIVKAWNSILTESFAAKGRPAGSANRIAISVAGDREADRSIAMALVEDTGFDAVDSGPLAESWRQQPGAPCYCTDLTREHLPAALALAERARLPRRRDLAVEAISERVGGGGINPDADYGVRVGRALYM